MKKANGHKRAPEPQPNENIQPALVNSAVAKAGDPLPEGNRQEFLDRIEAEIRASINGDATLRASQDLRRYGQEFERRTKAMPFIRFVSNGEPLPTEIGNVDKINALDGSGVFYLFPTSENLTRSYGQMPEDPTQGQEAQGGPAHSITGRGEKYAGGNVETEMVADEFKNPMAEGKGSQTGGTGIQRASLGDGSAIGAAVEDPDVSNKPDQHEDQAEGKDAGQPGVAHTPNAAVEAQPGVLRPLPTGAYVEQVSKGAYSREPGIIRVSRDVSKLRDKGDMFQVKTPEQPEQPTEDKTHLMTPNGEVTPGEGTEVNSKVADAMKEGNKTATDAAAAGAVSASHSTADLEDSSPGTVGGNDGLQSPDAGEGTAKDMANPMSKDVLDHDNNGEAGGSKPFSRDWDKEEIAEVRKFLEDAGVSITTGVSDTDLVAMAKKHDRFGGTDLAVQKSDEGTPQHGGGVIDGGEPLPEQTTEEKATDKPTKMHIGGSKSKAAAKPAAKK